MSAWLRHLAINVFSGFSPSLGACYPVVTVCDLNFIPFYCFDKRYFLVYQLCFVKDHATLLAEMELQPIYNQSKHSQHACVLKRKNKRKTTIVSHSIILLSTSPAICVVFHRWCGLSTVNANMLRSKCKCHKGWNLYILVLLLPWKKRYEGWVIPLLPNIMVVKSIHCIYKCFSYFIFSLTYTIRLCMVLKHHFATWHHATLMFLVSKLARSHTISLSCPIRMGLVSLCAVCCFIFAHLLSCKTLTSICRPAFCM